MQEGVVIGVGLIGYGLGGAVFHAPLIQARERMTSREEGAPAKRDSRSGTGQNVAIARPLPRRRASSASSPSGGPARVAKQEDA